MNPSLRVSFFMHLQDHFTLTLPPLITLGTNAPKWPLYSVSELHFHCTFLLELLFKGLHFMFLFLASTFRPSKCHAFNLIFEGDVFGIFYQDHFLCPPPLPSTTLAQCYPLLLPPPFDFLVTLYVQCPNT